VDGQTVILLLTQASVNKTQTSLKNKIHCNDHRT